jgi:hypothetical protein
MGSPLGTAVLKEDHMQKADTITAVFADHNAAEAM